MKKTRRKGNTRNKSLKTGVGILGMLGLLVVVVGIELDVVVD
jgi:hypothetical protein